MLLRTAPALSSPVLQIVKTGVFSNRTCRDDKLSSFNFVHIVISQAHEITLRNCSYELLLVYLTVEEYRDLLSWIPSPSHVKCSSEGTPLHPHTVLI